MLGPITYKVFRQDERRVFNIVGYKGQSELDSGYFFCPYIPGMSQEAMDEVTMALRSPIITPTPIQELIMEVVRNGTAQVHGPG